MQRLKDGCKCFPNTLNRRFYNLKSKVGPVVKFVPLPEENRPTIFSLEGMKDRIYRLRVLSRNFMG